MGINRNRKERYFNRDAINKAHTNMNELRKDLGELLDMEHRGKQLNKNERLQKKVLKEQFSASIRNSESVHFENNEKTRKLIFESKAIYDPIETSLGNIFKLNIVNTENLNNEIEIIPKAKISEISIISSFIKSNYSAIK